MGGHLVKDLAIVPTGENVARVCVEWLLSAEVGDLDVKGRVTAVACSSLSLQSLTVSISLSHPD
jgi:hypothetical protein